MAEAIQKNYVTIIGNPAEFTMTPVFGCAVLDVNVYRTDPTDRDIRKKYISNLNYEDIQKVY